MGLEYFLGVKVGPLQEPALLLRWAEKSSKNKQQGSDMRVSSVIKKIFPDFFQAVTSAVFLLVLLGSSARADEILFSDGFETATGWTINPSSTDTATDGQWERATPVATDYQVGTPHTGTKQLVTGSTGSSNSSDDLDGGTTSIRSPLIELPDSLGTAINLSLWHYFAHASSAQGDFLRIKLIGTTTSRTLYEKAGVSSTLSNPVWSELVADVSDFAGDSVYILVEAADAGAENRVEAGIDDVSVTISYPVFADDFETDKGWLPNPASTDTASDGVWERNTPAATSHQVGAAFSGDYQLVTGAEGSTDESDDVEGGVTRIRSPDITLPVLTNGKSLQIQFQHYFSYSAGASTANDYFRVSVVGATKSQVLYEKHSDSAGQAPSWELVDQIVDDFSGQTVHLLVEAFQSSAAIVEAGVDDVLIDLVPTPDVFSDDFETDSGWSVNPFNTDTATGGIWERGNPISSSFQLDTAHSGDYDLVTGAGTIGDDSTVHDIDDGTTSILSPPISLPALNPQQSLEVNLWKYLSNASTGGGAAAVDFLRITIIGSRQSLILYEQWGNNSGISPVWTNFNADISLFHSDTVQFLIEAADNGGGNRLEAAVDDFKITKHNASSNTNPVISLVSPANSSSHAVGANITFSATATSQGQDISGSIQWSSSIDGSLGTGTTLVVNDLSQGQHTIKAEVLDGQNRYGVATLTITVQPVAPGIPGSVTAPATNATGAFTVSWTAATGTVDNYVLEQQVDGGSWSEVYSGSSLSHGVTGLVDGSYVYRVKACNSAGCSSYATSSGTDVSIVVAPGIPGSVTAPATNATGAFTVSWTAATGTVDNYVLEQQLDGGSWSEAYSGASLSHGVTGLVDGSYVYRVKACNSAGCSSYATSSGTDVSIVVAPGIPGSVTAPATNATGAFTVSWTAATGTVDNYVLEQQIDGGSWSEIYSGASLSQGVTGLVDGSYVYRVKACNSADCSGYQTSSGTEVTIVVAPGIPASINAPATNATGAFTVSWTAGTGTIDNYVLEQQLDGGAWSEVYSGASLSHDLTGLVDGSYLYRISACNSAGCSSYQTSSGTDVSIVVAPGIPGSVTAPATNATGAFTVSWTAATGTVDNYVLEQQVDGGSWSEIYSGASLSHGVTGLVDGSYVYRVKACNSAGCSGTIATSGTTVDVPDAVPESPLTLTAPELSGNGAFTVQWASVSGVVDAYELEQQFNGGAWVQVYSGTALSQYFSTMADGTYIHRIRACNNLGCSAYVTSGATTLSLVEIPGIPGSINVPATNGSGAYSVSWAAAAGQVAQYVLERQKEGSAWDTLYFGSNSSADLTVAVDGNYLHRIKACNTGGCSDYLTSTATSVTLIPLPGIPGSVTVPASNATGSFTVSWGAASGDVDTYHLEQQINGTSWVEVWSGNALFYDLTGLVTGDYNYRVKACNAAGCGDYSESTTVSVTVADPIPEAPTSLTAPDINATGSFTLIWVAGSGVTTYYELEQQIDGGSWVQIYTGVITLFDISGLDNGSYAHRVRACNSTGCSEFTTTTPTVVTIPAPETPASISAPATNDTGAYTVSWNASPGSVDNYVLDQQKNGGSWAQVYSGENLSYDLTGLTDGSYLYRVSACNSSGCSGYRVSAGTEVALLTVPGVPESISAPATSETAAFTVSWDAATGTIENYFLEQQKDGGSWIQVYSGPNLNHSISDLFDGTYIYRVSACNVAGCSGYRTSTGTVVTYTNPDVVLFSDDFETDLGWVTNPLATDTATDGFWERGNPVATGRQLDNSHSGSYNLVTGAAGGSNTSDDLDGGRTSILSPAIDIPSLVSGESVVFSAWKYFAHGSSGAPDDYLKIYIQTQAGNNTEIFSVEGTGQGVSPVWSNVQVNLDQFSGQTIRIYIEAVATETSDQVVEAAVDDVEIIKLTPDFIVPGIPAGITAPANNDSGDFSVTWGGSTGALDNYVLEKKLDNGSWGEVYTGTELSYSFTGLPDGTYSFRVKACNSLGCGSYTSIATTLVNHANPPQIPSAIAVTSTGNTGDYEISWSNTGGTNEYKLQEQFNGGSWSNISLANLTDLSVQRLNLADGTYTYRVQACNNAGCSGYQASSGITVDSATSPPRTPEIDYFTEGALLAGFEIVWKKSPGTVTSYEMDVSQTGSSIWTSVANGTEFTSQNIDAPNDGFLLNVVGSAVGMVTGTYSFRIRACNNNGCSPYETLNNLIYLERPEQPVITLPELAPSGSFTVSWDAQSGVEYYTINRQKFGSYAWGQEVDQGSSTQVSYSNFQGVYQFSVSACNVFQGYELCNKSYSRDIIVGDVSGNGSLPLPPESFTNFLLGSTGNLTVVWSQNATDTQNVGNYELFKKYNGATNWEHVVSTFANSKKSGTIELPPDGTYIFGVRSCNAAGCSGLLSSEEIEVGPDIAPSKPGNLSAPDTSVTGAFSITWGGSYGATAYILELTDGANWQEIQNNLTKSYSANLTNGSYQFRVKACNSFGCSAYTTSNTTVVDTTTTSAPSAPATITNPATSTTGSYGVSWASATGNVTHYELERQVGSGSWSQIFSGTALSFDEASLANGNYGYRVRACNNTLCSAYATSGAATVVTLPTAPSAPASVTAPSSNATGAYTVSWAAATGTVTHYELERQFNAGAWTPISTASTTTSFAESGLGAGSYSYRVRACNTTPCSAYMTSGVTTVTATAGSAPSAPASISTPSSNTSGGFTVSWAAATGTVTGYTLQQQVNGGAWSTVYTGSATSKAVSGLSTGNYAYQVKACNNTLCSAYTVSGITNVQVTQQQGSGSVPTPPAPFNAIGSEGSLVPAADKTATDSVGSVAGSFRVNEAGAATYSIPIATVAGTAGVVPQVSMNYSSGGGNGLMGLGWSLDGLSAISRCRQTLHQDNKAKVITWSEEDRFCLDGQRLVVTSGTYGAPNSTYKTETDSFTIVTAMNGTVGQPNYFKVERKDGSTSYYGYDDAATKSHLMAGSKTLTWAISRFHDSVGNPIWFVYANDADGQRISEIRYAYGSATGPTGHNASIQFAYKAGTRTDPVVGYVAGYPFKSARLLDSVQSYNGASQVRQYKLTYLNANATDRLSRLAKVEDCSGGICLPATNFAWNLPQTGFASTYSSQVIMSSQNDRAVTDFKHLDINGDGRLDIAWNEPDWDNDGKIHDQYGKYVIANATGGFGPVQEFYANTSNTYTPFKLAVIDYNGDGRQDALVYMHTLWKVFLATPQQDNSWKLSTTAIDTPIANSDVLFADVNSDGLTDAIDASIGAGGVGIMTVRYLEKDSTQNVTSSRFYRFGNQQQLNWSASAEEPQFGGTALMNVFSMFKSAGDLNGDGMMDVMTREGLNLYGGVINLSIVSPEFRTVDAQGQTFSLYDTLPTGNMLTGSTYEFADFNGDGLTDVVQADYDVNTAMEVWYFALNTGAGFAERQALGVSYNYNDQDKPTPSFVDYNSDGYQDIYWHDYPNSKLKVKMWNPATNTFDAPVDARTTNGDANHVHMLMDNTGDGVVDYVYFHDDTLETFPGNSNNQPINLITAITNGLSATTSITYDSLSGSDHYERLSVGATGAQEEFCVPYTTTCISYTKPLADTSLFYSALNGSWNLPANSQYLEKNKPVLELNGPIRVVTRVESDAPTSASSTAKSAIEYFYAQARIQASGRGYLGFEQLKTKDLQTGVETTTAYRQDWPFIGYPLRTEVRTSSGALLSEAENTWKLKDWQSGWSTTAATSGTAALLAVKPFIEKSVEKTYNLTGGALLQTVTTDNVYDDYGNPTSITVTTDGSGSSLAAANANFQKITTNTYGSTDWEQEKGRLATTTVVSKRDDDNNGSYEKTSTRTSSFTYYTTGATKGLLNTETIEPGNSQLSVTTTHSYDAFGNKVRAKTETGDAERCNFDTVAYDSRGRYPVSTYDCLGRKVSEVMSRNDFGAPTEVKTYISDTSSAGTSTYYRYTTRGTQYFTASSTGAWQASTLHSGAGVCPSGTAYYAKNRSAGGAEQRVCFDKLGREVATLQKSFDGSQWATVQTQYDSLGRVARKSDPYFSGSVPWTTLGYDILGRVTSTALPDGSSLSSNYATPYVTEITNDAGQKKQETRNALSELVKVVDNSTGTGNDTSLVLYRYDAQGNLTQTEDSAGNVTTLTYDLLGRKTSMADPDKGNWSYEYNGFGELTKQTDGNTQTSTLTYDGLGRMQTRVDKKANGTIDGNTTWAYDTATNGLGQLDNVQDSVTGYIKGVEYDAYGRPSSTVTSLGVGGADGDHFEKVTYDQFGRTYQVFDAARNDETFTDNGVEHVYNAQGYLEKLVDAVYANGSPRATYRTIQAMDARGNVTVEQLGSNVLPVASTTRAYDAMGRIDTIKSIFGVFNDPLTPGQDLNFDWDTLGNLTKRTDKSGSKDVYETFTYDGLNRLKTATVSGQTAKSYRYDSLGNITFKSDVCPSSTDCYSYGAGNAGAHAVTSAGGVTYSYDNNGNNTGSSDGRTITYTSYDMAATVSKGGHVTTFSYGPDRARYKRVDQKDGSTQTTLYIGSVEKITKADGTKQVKRYIGGVVIETESYTSGGSKTGEEKHYTLKDHLGSNDILLDSVGNLITNGGQLGFDPWGQRRNGATWADISASQLIASYGVFASLAPPTTRGFTGHEMADDVGIIHMNGRIYDPRLGRFLQADPFVQDAGSTQSYNRYSYLWNNPLNGTDPSGYFGLKDVFKIAIVVAISIVTYGAASTWAMGVALNSSMVLSGGLAAASTFAGIVGGAVAGFTAGVFGAVMSGASPGEALEAGAWGALSGGVFGGIGGASYNWQAGTKIAAHSMAGGVMNVLQGGKFGHGFVSSGFTKFASLNWISQIQGKGLEHIFARTAIAATVGGTVSELTGGKFANGARTSAYAHLFNQESSIIKDDFSQKLKGVFNSGKNWISNVLKSSTLRGSVGADVDIGIKLPSGARLGAGLTLGSLGSTISSDSNEQGYDLTVAASGEVVVPGVIGLGGSGGLAYKMSPGFNNRWVPDSTPFQVNFGGDVMVENGVFEFEMGAILGVRYSFDLNKFNEFQEGR